MLRLYQLGIRGLKLFVILFLLSCPLAVQGRRDPGEWFYEPTPILLYSSSYGTLCLREGRASLSGPRWTAQGEILPGSYQLLIFWTSRNSDASGWGLYEFHHGRWTGRWGRHTIYDQSTQSLLGDTFPDSF